MKILKIETPNFRCAVGFCKSKTTNFYRSNERLYYDRVKTTPINMAIKDY
ncbi:MAG: hypothetical protein J7J38_01910 [Candidatus Aenigmarchaeota archaeon]|nr:hypothetical protein [Candidatus Aenigmarchaeota archaeon]